MSDEPVTPNQAAPFFAATMVLYAGLAAFRNDEDPDRQQAARLVLDMAELLCPGFCKMGEEFVARVEVAARTRDKERNP